MILKFKSNPLCLSLVLSLVYQFSLVSRTIPMRICCPEHLVHSDSLFYLSFKVHFVLRHDEGGWVMELF